MTEFKKDNDIPPGKIKWLHVIRDVIILTVFVFLGGAIVGFACAPNPPSEIGLSVSSLLMGTLGFWLCGYLTVENKWKHLFVVALAFLLTNYMPFFLFKSPNVYTFVTSIAFVLIMMLIGGGLSFLVKAPKIKESNISVEGKKNEHAIIPNVSGDDDRKYEA